MTDATPALGSGAGEGRPSILFACRKNAGRSVTGKLLAEHYAAGAVDVASAGSEPGDDIHPEVAAVLSQLGLDPSAETPKGFDPAGRYDIVVTMGCGEACPVFLGARYADWELDDPKDQDEATVRRIVADIDRRVRQLVAELVPERELPPRVTETAADR